ncbi:MAG: hypothetical protein RI988_377 [Pseudomonadota bacterium]|jgi:hypothetical protein
MAPAGYPALVFTVALLVITAYFLLGGLPLLVLQHDTPLDGRFIGRFFEVYYQVALYSAAGACLSYAAWGRLPFALGAAAIGAAVLALRRRVVPAMATLGQRIASSDATAVRDFRRVHAGALAMNLTQLVVLVWALMQLQL